MITIGSATLKELGIVHTGYAAQPRIVAYVGTRAEFEASQAKAAGAALIAPYTVFFEVTYAADNLTILSYFVHLPVDSGGGYASAIPVRWEDPGFTDPAVTPANLNQRIDGNNIFAAYFKVPRGPLADRVACPTSEGLMYYATDSNELYIFTAGAWKLLAAPPESAVIGLMYGWPDTLPPPSSKFLACDGSLVTIAGYPDLYMTYGTTFNSPINPPDGIHFQLPLQTNTVIRAEA